MKLKISIAFLTCIVIVIFFPTKPSIENLKHIEFELHKYKTHFIHSEYAILIDCSKPIYRKRLWIIDLKTKEIILNSHVSHARNSGLIYASKFSNIENSRISSKGTFITSNSYESQFGKGEYKIGMRIKGLEKGMNHNAFKRNIVFHCSYSPWSSGCFMTPPKTNKKIIDLTKNGNIVIVL